MSRNWINKLVTENINSQLKWYVSWAYINIEKGRECVVINNKDLITESKFVRYFINSPENLIIRYVNLEQIFEIIEIQNIETQDRGFFIVLTISLGFKVKDPIKLLMMGNEPIDQIKFRINTFFRKIIATTPKKDINEIYLKLQLQDLMENDPILGETFEVCQMDIYHKDTQTSVRTELDSLQGQGYLQQAQQEQQLLIRRRQAEFDAQLQQREAEFKSLLSTKEEELRQIKNSFDSNLTKERQMLEHKLNQEKDELIQNHEKELERMKAPLRIMEAMARISRENKEYQTQLAKLLMDVAKHGVSIQEFLPLIGAISTGNSLPPANSSQQNSGNPNLTLSNRNFCPVCGHENRSQAKFCSSCGCSF